MLLLSTTNQPTMEYSPNDPPPAYSPKCTFNQSKLPAYEPSDLLPPSQSGEPGYAVESVLTRGLQVPSKSEYFTSGFAYPPLLANYNITRQDWTRFTQEITSEAKLSPRQWSTAIGKGLGVLAIGGLMIGVFSTVPAYLTARRVRRNHEHRNLVYKSSQLSRKIERWNETFFAPRGILIRVDLPAEAVEDIEIMDVSTSRSFQERERQQQQQLVERRSMDSQSSGGSVRTRPLRETLTALDDRTAREEASLKGRIVVIPLQGLPLRQSGTSSSTIGRQGRSEDRIRDRTVILNTGAMSSW